MKQVVRSEVLSWKDYENVRGEFRAKILKEKEDRRIHLGEHLTFLFETHNTILYQIQEMVRTERMERENDIRHEIETYNELIGEKGQLGCTMMIEIDNKELRDKLLHEWIQLPQFLKIRTNKGLVSAKFDERQLGEERLSSVQYLKFNLGDQVPEALVCDMPNLKLEAQLSPRQAAALTLDVIS